MALNHAFNSLIKAFLICLLVQTSYTAARHVKRVKKYSSDTDCGYATCPKVKDDYINVHLVSHTHDDVGWLKTVDQYYYGSHTRTQRAGVQYILDSVIQELLHDPNKKFVYVETEFFWKWWMHQHDIIRHQVKKLVQKGQLEFIGGAWSMNDEAVTNYQSIIDQFTWGLRKLNETFGECGHPRVGWQIDPFGHSREMASLFAQMGYDGLFFGRLDYQDKHTRLLSKTAEMVWEGSANLGKSSNIFTSILFNNYSPPPGFCFDVLCSDEPIIDDKDSPDYNVNEKVSTFVKYILEQAGNYSTNNILLTMGGDFTYQDAHMWYKNLDLLIRYVNTAETNRTKINVFYSSPSCYLKALNDAQKAWPTKQDDFFPYASDPHAYWTGYFSSRPTIKYFERLGNNFLQVCKQLYALTSLDPADWADLNTMREAMGILQHHDAITGTEKQVVAQDYARILSKGIAECQFTSETAINKIINPTKGENINGVPKLQMALCLQLNISQCRLSEDSDTFVVTVYNPLSRPVSHHVRLPVGDHSYTVLDQSGTKMTIQMAPVPDAVRTIPGRLSDTKQELVFLARDLPPLGFRSYFIAKSSSDESTKRDPSPLSEVHFIETEKLKFHFDKTNGNLHYIETKGNDPYKIKQDFFYYKGSMGDNLIFLNRSSGAYIFRPNGSEPVKISENPSSKMYNGSLFFELHQVFSSWVSQVIRVYHDKPEHTEFEWLIGPIPIEDGIGKEVISRFTSDIVNNGQFYTDSNGREMLLRKKNFRPTWKVNISEEVAGNYYPVTSKIRIQDEKKSMAVLTDRAQGGSSLSDGQIELMVHRRLLHDDAFGVDEALNETAFGKGLVVRGKHYLWIGNVTRSDNITTIAQERLLAEEKLLSPWLFLTNANGISYETWKQSYKMEYSGLKQSLPPNVHVLTLEPWTGSSLLLRLEHIMEKTDDPVLSKPVTVSLKDLLAPFSIISVRETTLAANQWIENSERLEWHFETNEITKDYEPKKDRKHLRDLLRVTLTPMQIRTFVIDIKRA